jgi:hypothetical protein
MFMQAALPHCIHCIGTSRIASSKEIVLLRELAGLQTPVWLREHAISQVLHPVHLLGLNSSSFSIPRDLLVTKKNLGEINIR